MPPELPRGYETLAYGKKAAPLVDVPLRQKAPKALKGPPSRVIPFTQQLLLAPTLHSIQGLAASEAEWRIYQTLHKLGWPESEIQFQVDVYGNGGRLPGGLLLDFVVWTPGMATIIEPASDFWNAKAPQVRQRDLSRMAAVQRVTSQPFRYFSLGATDLLDDGIAWSKLSMIVGRF